MRIVELLGKELVFPLHLEEQEDIFWFLDEKSESSSQFLCVFINSFKTKKEWGKIMLKTKKGCLEGRASHMSRVWIFVSSSNKST